MWVRTTRSAVTDPCPAHKSHEFTRMALSVTGYRLSGIGCRLSVIGQGSRISARIQPPVPFVYHSPFVSLVSFVGSSHFPLSVGHSQVRVFRVVRGLTRAGKGCHREPGPGETAEAVTTSQDPGKRLKPSPRTGAHCRSSAAGEASQQTREDAGLTRGSCRGDGGRSCRTALCRTRHGPSAVARTVAFDGLEAALAAGGTLDRIRGHVLAAEQTALGARFGCHGHA